MQASKACSSSSSKEELQVLGTWDCGSPLYDSFELASLHYILEKHTMMLPFAADAAAVSRSSRRHRRGGAAPPPDMANTGGTARRRRRTARGWRGCDDAAAAIFRALGCWRS